LYIFHDSPEAGHLGVKKTKEKIKQRLFWNGMNKDIHSYVKTCHVCPKTKSEKLRPPGLLGTVKPATAIFESLYIDLQGPLPISQKRNKFILVIVDQLSKWVEFFAIPTATAHRIVQLMEDHVFCRFGVPKNIITDQGSQFISKLLAKCCQEWGIKHYFCSPYHPQPNISEKTNQTLKTMIASYVENNHTKWDIHLQKFALALRTAVNVTTKCSPSLLNLGREIKLPFDNKIFQQSPTITDPSIIANTLPEQLNEIITFVRNNIVTAHEQSKKYYDSKHREIKYNPGELVMLKTHYLSDKDKKFASKLAPKWSGPYTIKEEVNKVTYKILDGTKELRTPYHVQNLKPYYPRKTVTFNLNRPDENSHPESNFPNKLKKNVTFQLDRPDETLQSESTLPKRARKSPGFYKV